MASYDVLLWLHVLVMGYWIGSDLVVNALTHYVAYADRLSGAERKRLWDFLLHVDQHPRNALILSVPLGFTLAAQIGLARLDDAALIVLWLGSAAWFAHMWVTHLRRETSSGAALARLDVRIRVILIATFLFIGVQSLRTGSPLAAPWLAWKTILFAGVMACGLGIRHCIRRCYAAWPQIWSDRGTPEDEALLRKALMQGTRVLWVLWLLLFVIGWLGVTKPGAA